MSFRKEKKYRLSRSDMLSVMGHLSESGMTRLHPTRFIHSCYFDSVDYKMHFESEEGVVPRKKIRVRWYNNSKNFSKEIKISSEEGRFKYTELLPSIYGPDDLLGMTMFDTSYGTLSAVMTVSYEREYFSFNNLRITFDSNITYKHLKFVTQPSFNDKECVMEVKVPIDCDDDYIEKIVHQPTSRFSKYSRGMLFVEHKV